MSHIIRLRVGELEYEAQLNESKTAQAIYDALPIECIGSRWGAEYYSRIDVQMTRPTTRDPKWPSANWPTGPPAGPSAYFLGPPPPPSATSHVRPAR